MPKNVSDTLELHRTAETAPPTSGTVPSADPRALEGLLVTLSQLPPAASLTDAVARLLYDFSAVLPGCALGVRIPASNGSPHVFLTNPPIETPPEGLWERNITLFPAYPHERHVQLSCRPQPACLHCAADAPALQADGSPLSQTVEICGRVLSTAIRLVDAQQALRRKEEEVASLRNMLIQSDKLSSLGKLSAGMVHELSNPLTSIIAYTDFLRNDAEQRGDDPKNIERLRRVGEAADRILGFTQAIVSHAKPEDDAPYPVHVERAVEQALLFCKHTVDASHVVIRRNIDPTVPRVRSVQSQLTQVVVNLVTNACQAMAPHGGTLTISVQVDPPRNSVSIRVDDTGPGIEPEHVDRVFDAFFTTKGEGVGTGLGLNIVRDIVQRGGGSIQVESPPGKGASFIVGLPIYTPEAR